MENFNPQHVNYFGSNLKFLLKEFDVNQADLALQTNKKSSSISNWVNEITFPNVIDLIAIRHFFGISIDALIFTDFRNGKILTKEHIEEFQRNGKVLGKVLGKVQPVSGQYFAHNSDVPFIAKEPEPAYSNEALGYIKMMDGKLDLIRISVEELLKKAGK